MTQAAVRPAGEDGSHFSRAGHYKRTYDIHAAVQRPKPPRFYAPVHGSGRNTLLDQLRSRHHTKLARGQRVDHVIDAGSQLLFLELAVGPAVAPHTP